MTPEIMERLMVEELCREYRELKKEYKDNKDNQDVLDRLCEIEEALAWLDP